MRLSLLAIMLDEIDYVERWLQTVDRAQALGCPFDQIVVVDGGSTDGTIERLIQRQDVTVVMRRFDGNFAEQRNFGIDVCRNDWIFELDADEKPAVPLLAGLSRIAGELARVSVECAGIVRLNIIDGRLVEGPGTGGLDYQYRLHRRECRWQGAVHEEIVGWTNRVELDFHDGHFIVHDKASARHRARNDYYDILAGGTR